MLLIMLFYFMNLLMLLGNAIYFLFCGVCFVYSVFDDHLVCTHVVNLCLFLLLMCNRSR
jgi:hypothetical protein